MREPKGWVQEYPDEWQNDDFTYPLTVVMGDLIGYHDKQAYIAYLWIEHPGVRYTRNGDGIQPDWGEFEIGTFDTLDEAQQAAEVTVSEWEARDAAWYERMMAEAEAGGWNE
jgi:hypothetical protein